MKIRKYCETDLEHILELHRIAVKRENVYRGDGVWEEDLYDIENHYFNNNGYFLVGEKQGQLIAMGALRKISLKTAEITRMRVHPEYQRLGYGQHILDKLHEIAARLNYKETILETDERLVKAIRFYTKNGYAYWKAEQVDGYECFWYRKYIHQA